MISGPSVAYQVSNAEVTGLSRVSQKGILNIQNQNYHGEGQRFVQTEVL